jgi:hypothetical protein
MTTTTWASIVDQSTDAAFRVWGLEFAAKLAVVGLVQTADTGQINWVTVNRAGANTAAGYEIWRFADSTIYMKIEYGSGGANTNPNMWITVGTGSNGSGTITGQTNTRSTFVNTSLPTSGVTVLTSYMCAVADAFSVAWKLSGSTIVGATLVVGKTVDGTGVATSTGFGVLRQQGNAQLSFQSVRTASTATTFTDATTMYLCTPGNPTSTDVGSNKQAYEIWLNVPEVIPFNWANGVLLTEAPRGTSLVVAMTGTTTHTYLAIGQNGNTQLASAGIANIWAGIIYE